MENTTARLAEEELQPAKRSERMVGSFLRKSERKFSRKREKKKKQKQKQNKTKKGEMEKF